MVGNVNVLEQTAYFPSGPVEIVYQKSENDLKLVSYLERVYSEIVTWKVDMQIFLLVKFQYRK